MFLQGNKLVLGPFRNKNMPGIECKFSSLSAKIKLKQIKILTSCHRSASKNPKDLLAGLLFFFFSSNRRSAVLKLCKSWYETLFFADRVVIAAILNSLEILSFRSVIRYTADNCQRARNVLDFWRCSSIGWEDLHLEVEQTANNPHPLPLSS